MYFFSTFIFIFLFFVQCFHFLMTSKIRRVRKMKGWKILELVKGKKRVGCIKLERYWYEIENKRKEINLMDGK